MSDNTKIVIESDSKGRINISCEDDNGAGHGYRLAGPKYNLGGGDLLARRELDERDVQEIRIYLKLWDEIQARKAQASALSGTGAGE